MTTPYTRPVLTSRFRSNLLAAFTQSPGVIHVVEGDELSSFCVNEFDRDEWTFDVNSLASNPEVAIQANLAPPGTAGLSQLRILDPSNSEIDCAQGTSVNIVFDAGATGTYRLVFLNNGDNVFNYNFAITSENTLGDPSFDFSAGGCVPPNPTDPCL